MRCPWDGVEPSSFDCHRWRYDTQFCETAKQDGFGGVFGPETALGKRPVKRSFFETPWRRRWQHEISGLNWRNRTGDEACSDLKVPVLMYLTL